MADSSSDMTVKMSWIHRVGDTSFSLRSTLLIISNKSHGILTFLARQRFGDQLV